MEPFLASHVAVGVEEEAPVVAVDGEGGRRSEVDLAKALAEAVADDLEQVPAPSFSGVHVEVTQIRGLSGAAIAGTSLIFGLAGE